MTRMTTMLFRAMVVSSLPFPPILFTCFETKPEDYVRCCIAIDENRTGCNEYYDNVKGNCCNDVPYSGPRIHPQAQRIRAVALPDNTHRVMYVHTMAHLDFYHEVRATAQSAHAPLYSDATREWYFRYPHNEFTSLPGSHFLRSTLFHNVDFFPPYLEPYASSDKEHDFPAQQRTSRSEAFAGPLHAGYVIRSTPLFVRLASTPRGIHPSYVSTQRGRVINPSCGRASEDGKDPSNYLSVRFTEVFGSETVRIVSFGCTVADLRIFAAHATRAVEGLCVQMGNAEIAKIRALQKTEPKLHAVRILHRKWVPASTADILRDVIGSDIDILWVNMNFYDCELTSLVLRNFFRPSYLLQWVGPLTPVPFRFHDYYDIATELHDHKIHYDLDACSLSQMRDLVEPYRYHLLRVLNALTLWRRADKSNPSTTCNVNTAQSGEKDQKDVPCEVDVLACYVMSSLYMSFPYVYLRDWLTRHVDDARVLVQGNITRMREAGRKGWIPTTFW